MRKQVLMVLIEGTVFGATFVSLCWLVDDLGLINLIP